MAFIKHIFPALAS